MFRVEIQLDANSSVEVMSNLVEEESDNDEVVSRCVSGHCCHHLTCVVCTVYREVCDLKLYRFLEHVHREAHDKCMVMNSFMYVRMWKHNA